MRIVDGDQDCVDCEIQKDVVVRLSTLSGKVKIKKDPVVPKFHTKYSRLGVEMVVLGQTNKIQQGFLCRIAHARLPDRAMKAQNMF